MRMTCERVLYAEFVALYDRPWSYKMLKKSKTLAEVILEIKGSVWQRYKWNTFSL